MKLSKKAHDGLNGDYSWPDGSLRIVFRTEDGGFTFKVSLLPGKSGRVEISQKRLDDIASVMSTWASVAKFAVDEHGEDRRS